MNGAATIKESDWKVYRTLVDLAVERFYARAVADMERLMADEDKSGRERFWDAYELAKKRRKQAADIFDPESRSTVLFHLSAMRRENLLTEEEFARFSRQTQDLVNGFLDIVRR